MAGSLLYQEEAEPEPPPSPPSPEQLAQRAKWDTLAATLHEHIHSLFDGKRRLFVRMFALDSGLCQRQSWADFDATLSTRCFESRPDAAELVAFARRFLGLFMINRFDLLLFLEDAGLWRDSAEQQPVSDSDNEEEDYDDELWRELKLSRQDGDTAERKYAAATFEAAGLAVQGLLQLLVDGSYYSHEELEAGLQMAATAVVELPRCAVLGAYLPGPLNVVKHELIGKYDGEVPELEEVEANLRRKYAHIAPRFNFRRAAAAVLASDLRVVRSKQMRMRVVAVEERRRITFCSAAACDAAAAGTPLSDSDMEEVKVELDPEIGALLMPGMTVTGQFCALNDGSWYYAQPGYVWPSFYYHPGSGPCSVDDAEEEEDDAYDSGEEDPVMYGMSLPSDGADADAS